VGITQDEDDSPDLDYDEVYDGEVFIVTDEISNFEKGKTLSCPNCDHSIGLPYGEKTWKCYGCLAVHVDEEGGDREPPERDEGQTGLNQFL